MRTRAGGSTFALRSLPVVCGVVLGACASRPQAWALSAWALTAWSYAHAALVAPGRTSFAERFGPSALGIVVMQLVGHAWLVNAPNSRGGAGMLWGLAALLLVASLQSAWIVGCHVIASVGMGVGGHGRRGGGQAAWIGGIGWSLAWGCADALRQLGPCADAYALLGIPFVDLPGVAPMLPLLGLSVTTSLLAAFAWSLALAVRRSSERWAGSPIVAAVAALGIAAILAIAFQGAGPSASSTDAGRRIPVAVVQLARDKRAQWDAPLRDAQDDRLLAALRSLPPGGVAVTPETYFPEPRPSTRTDFWDALDAATVDGRHAIVGMPVRFVSQAGGQVHQANALVDFAPGRMSVYAKERLVPGVELLPELRWLQPLVQAAFGHGRSEDPGPDAWHQPLFAGGSVIGASICHELAFERLVAQRARGAGWLLNAAEDGWLHSEAFDRQMTAIARVRALETGKAVLRASNLGASALIGADGRILELAPARAAVTLRWAVPDTDGETFHTRHADWLFFLPCVGALIVSVGGALHRAGHRRPGPSSAEGIRS